MRRFKKGSRNSRLMHASRPVSDWRGELNLPYPGKRVEVLTQIANGREGKDRTNDKEEDEASCREEKAVISEVAPHRLGQPDHADKSPRKTGERSRGIVLRGSCTSVYLTG